MSLAQRDIQDTSPQALGSEIRQLRKARGMTLTDLAEAIGKTPGFLSQIERGLAKPSLKTLQTLGEALGVGITWFFEGADSDSENEAIKLVVRANKRRRIKYSPLADTDYLNFEDHLLSPNLDGSMVFGTTTFGPGGSYGDDLSTNVEYFLYVLEGSISLDYDGTSTVLRAGDSFQYDGSKPHRLFNHTDQDAVTLWGQSPVRFQF